MFGGIYFGGAPFAGLEIISSVETPQGGHYGFPERKKKRKKREEEDGNWNAAIWPENVKRPWEIEEPVAEVAEAPEVAVAPVVEPEPISGPTREAIAEAQQSLARIETLMRQEAIRAELRRLEIEDEETLLLLGAFDD